MKIKNLAVVESLTVDFQAGLNILTGETGAGKSIIVGALGLVLGARAQSDQIKTGADEAEVQAFIEVYDAPLLQRLGIDVGEGVIVRRIISRNGKGRAYINDTLVNVRSLDELGRDLVDIHGQHEHQSLTASDKQLELIDRFGKLTGDLDAYKALYEEVVSVRDELERLKTRAKERAHRIDLLKYQIEEIRSANITPGEMSELEEQRKILFHSTKLRELCENAYGLIREQEGAIVDNMNAVIAYLKTITEFDQAAGEPLELLNSALPLIGDSAVTIRDMREKYHADPSRLESIEKRLDTIRGLQKKYGDTEERILDYLNGAVTELDGLLASDETIEELEERLGALRPRLKDMGNEISEKRRAVSEKIRDLVTEKLGELAFKKAVFTVDIRQERDETGEPAYGPKGCDRAAFLFSANPSEPPKPLKKAASGGELSRIMLAIKSVFAEVDDIPVMVFDEIDAGIGGETATRVGAALKDLSTRHQILCVTHLAQIASKADAHFSIEKKPREKRVQIDVKLLNGDERINEIARMLSGEVTPTSLKHSEELLSR